MTATLPDPVPPPATGPRPADDPGSSPLRHLPALDGLRGIAVLFVLVFHVGLLAQPEGLGQRLVAGVAGALWSGVDLFFVLSGFLITGILLETRDSPGYFRAFYARRTLRIFPLYYAFLALYVGLLAGVLFPGMSPRAEAGTPWLWAYLTNVRIAAAKFGGVPTGTEHLWSLAIEEQFYLVWPLAVLLVPRRRLAAVAASLVGVAVAGRLAVLALGVPPRAVLVLTPLRLDALLVGALVAILLRDEAGRALLARWRRPVAWGSGLVVAALFWLLGGINNLDPWVQRVGFLALALLYGTWVHAGATAAPGSALVGALGRPWLTGVGRVSYAMYVLHWPLLLGLARFGVAPSRLTPLVGSAPVAWALFGAGFVALTYALAWVSWHLLEKHALALKRLVPYGAAAPAPAAPVPAVAVAER